MGTTLTSHLRSRPAAVAFVASALFLAFSYGMLAGLCRWFPSGLYDDALAGWQSLRDNGDAATTWYRKTLRQPGPPAIQNPGGAHPGWNLVTEIDANELCVRLIDLDGTELRHWALDWFQLWPDATHIPDRLRPRSQPGTHINGATLLPEGDLVCNFEHLGLVRVDWQGKVVWRLPYQTHHSVWRAEDGRLWVCGQREHTEPSPRLPNLRPPFVEDTILVVHPSGRIEREWSVLDLLLQNGRQGLLAMSNRDDFDSSGSGDITHLNHVEPFPTRLRPGYFQPGDVLVSLRNIHTVLVFDSATGQIKLQSTGQFVRQHDPHFVDGNHLSVFDNNTAAPDLPQPQDLTQRKGRAQSRIAILHGPSLQVQTWFAGTAEQPFYTPILGRHQWLPNGNLLITDSCAGRAFELNRNRQVVWWYINYTGPQEIGAVEQVERVPVGHGMPPRAH